MKIKWKVQDAPTGQFRSFFKRGWPLGEVNGQPFASFGCKDDYSAKAARGEIEHAPLKVYIADWRQPRGFTWRKMKGEFASLVEAKAAAQKLLDANPDILTNTS